MRSRSNACRNPAGGRAMLAVTMSLVLVGCADTSPPVQAQFQVTGVEKEALCSACHTPRVGAKTPSSPALAGQPKAYLVAQLQAFHARTRADADGQFFMWPMAASLDEAAIDHLAGYFSAQHAAPAASGPDANDGQGKALFASGAPERGVVPCSSCHGDHGQGVADFPRLAGQRRDYLAAQLHAFADGARPNPIMGAMAKSLSAGDIEHVTAYLESL